MHLVGRVFILLRMRDPGPAGRELHIASPHTEEIILARRRTVLFRNHGVPVRQFAAEDV